MLSGRGFIEVGDNLALGFQMDRIFMAIVRTQRTGMLEKKDRLIIEEGKQFLQSVLRGERILDELLAGKGFPADSSVSSRAFGKAVKALPEIRTCDEFVLYINKLIGISDSLLMVVVIDDLQLLRNFFGRCCKELLIRNNRILYR